MNRIFNEIGLLMDHGPILDGEIHRCNVDGRTGKDGWYVGQDVNGKVFATLGRWDTGQVAKYASHQDSELSSTDWEMIKFLREKAAMEKTERHAKARQVASDIWEKSAPCGDHPYLEKKHIRCMDVARELDGMIIVPIYNGCGELVNLQRIWADGTKKFLYGGEISGCATAFVNKYVSIHNTICICEGFATGASIYEATGHKTIIAFNAHNLVDVAKETREKNPNARIIICADNDHERKQGNIGIEKGKEAATVSGGVLRVPPRKDGQTDFNDFRCSDGLRAVADIVNLPPNILTVEDFAGSEKASDLTLDIPSSLLSVPGLISDGLEACGGGDIADIVQYNYPLIMSLIARAIAGKIRYGQVWPSLYNIKVGGTSTGKTDSDKMMKAAIRSAGLEDFYGPTDFSSGPGLLRGLAEQPQCLVNVDEISYMFKRYDKPDPISAGKIQALLELFSAAGQELKKPYGDSKKSILIEEPCLILLGNATPGIFDDLRPEDFESGLIQRFDFWYYGGDIPYRDGGSIRLDALKRFVDGLSGLFSAKSAGSELQKLLGSACDIGANSDAKKKLYEYSHSVIDAANGADNAGEKGIQSRRYHTAIKYAMIHAASVRGAGHIFEPLDVSDFDYGIALADLLARWKIKSLAGRVHEGSFHRDCEFFKEAIRGLMKKGTAKPTIAKIIDRKKPLKRLKPREIDEIVTALVARGEVEVDKSGRVDVYYLKKTEV